MRKLLLETEEFNWKVQECQVRTSEGDRCIDTDQNTMQVFFIMTCLKQDDSLVPIYKLKCDLGKVLQKLMGILH